MTKPLDEFKQGKNWGESIMLKWIIESIGIDCKTCPCNKECWEQSEVTCADILMARFEKYEKRLEKEANDDEDC